jgi:ABC-type nitrate/sulfonate/bicarbonate transport system permease component
MSTTNLARQQRAMPMRLKRRTLAIAGALFPFAVLLGIWQLITMAELMPHNFLPAPYEVLRAWIEVIEDGSYLRNVSASLIRVGIGFAVSATLGIGLGVLMGLSRGIADFIQPLASFLNALSGIAWVPLAITWFGLGPVAVTFIIWNAIFFLVLFNTLVGIKVVPMIYENAVLTLGGNRRQIITQVLIPGALPNVMTGLRMGMGFGWRALIVAEMIAASSGLGFMIFDARYYQRADLILVGIVTIGLIWLATDRLLLVPMERWTIERWGLVSKLQ